MCLGVHMPEHYAFELVRDGLLARDMSRGGWRVYVDLDFGCLPHEWFKVFYPPMGVDTWAEKALSHCFHSKINSVCCKCRKAGKVWVAGQYFQFAEYCSSCWNDWYYRHAS